MFLSWQLDICFEVRAKTVQVPNVVVIDSNMTAKLPG